MKTRHYLTIPCGMFKRAIAAAYDAWFDWRESALWLVTVGITLGITLTVGYQVKTSESSHLRAVNEKLETLAEDKLRTTPEDVVDKIEEVKQALAEEREARAVDSAKIEALQQQVKAMGAPPAS